MGCGRCLLACLLRRPPASHARKRSPPLTQQTIQNKTVNVLTMCHNKQINTHTNPTHEHNIARTQKINKIIKESEEGK